MTTGKRFSDPGDLTVGNDAQGRGGGCFRLPPRAVRPAPITACLVGAGCMLLRSLLRSGDLSDLNGAALPSSSCWPWRPARQSGGSNDPNPFSGTVSARRPLMDRSTLVPRSVTLAGVVPA
jgi:hypothetical protein